MLKFIAAIALLLFACGAPLDEEEGLYIGTLEQGIFVPVGYGAESGTQNGVSSPPCDDTDWAGGQCSIPDSKFQIYKFFASSCSSWWQARFVGAENYVKPFVNGLGDDWAYYGGDINGVYTHGMYCNTSSGLGAFTPGPDFENHATPLGTLRQYKNGTIRIDTADIEAQAGWSSKTEAERIRFAENVIRHEMGHSLGFGHFGSGLMQDGTNATWYSNSKTFTIADRTVLRCYNEDSGSSPDC